MIRWATVDREDLYGRAYCASLHQAYCAVFVPGMVVADYTDELKASFENWKKCAENTLYQIALNCPSYAPPIDCLQGLVRMFKTESNEVFYCGNILTKADLLGTLAIDHLFIVKIGEIRVQCVVSMRDSGVHIARSVIDQELDIWKTMLKGIE